MIFEERKSKIFKKKKFRKKIGKNKIWENFFFQLQVTIPSAHPVQISSRSDYCITLS